MRRERRVPSSNRTGDNTMNHSNKNRASRRRMRAFIAVSMGIPTAAGAQQVVEEVIVTGYAERQLLLDTESVTASRLGLSVRETPALIDIVTHVQLLERGARTSIETFNAAPGVTSANLASSPGVLSMRGFTSGAISLLHDGIRTTSSGMVTRNQDSWAFERVEVLKGPSSVLYGEGALAGAVNMVPKRARPGSNSFSWLVGAGSFDTVRGAIDGNASLGERAALRFVGSYSDTEGYVDDTAFETGGASLSWLWHASGTLTVDLAVDYNVDDYETAHWGTPLVPENSARQRSDVVRTTNGYVLDRSLRDANYNVENALSDSEATWVRSRVTWQVSDTWKMTNELNYYDALRRWQNSENYTFNAATQLLDRGTTLIEHDHQFWSERLLLSSDSSLAGHRNRFSIGAEYSDNDFVNPRRFGTTTSIDPHGNERALFPQQDDTASFPGAGNRATGESYVDDAAVFAENAFSVTSRWLLVAGLRYETIDLERTITDLNVDSVTRFSAEYDPLSWRVGTTYDVAPKTQVFAQYSSAVIPVSTIFLMSSGSAGFDLSTGKSVEAGMKSSLWGERVDVTFSAFRIRQDDILTRDAANSTIVYQGGRQSSRGVELSLSSALTDNLRLDASLSAIDAKFDTLIEAGGADRSGNTPPNVSETVAGLFAIYRFDAVPVSASFGARYASHFYTNTANTVRVEGHTTVDASLGYRLLGGELTVRGRNLTDELYAEWTGSSATQVLLGAPRSFDVSFTGRF
jgi:iron complex outermembrane receptor protein